ARAAGRTASAAAASRQPSWRSSASYPARPLHPPPSRLRSDTTWNRRDPGASAPLPQRDQDAVELALPYQGVTPQQHPALRPELRLGRAQRRPLAVHPDPPVMEHQRQRDAGRLVAALEVADLQRRGCLREVAGIPEVARVAQFGLPVELPEEDDPV